MVIYASCPHVFIVHTCIAYVASGGLALTFDGFIFAVTVVKLFGHLVEMRKMTNRGGITALILRDGSIFLSHRIQSLRS